jgi:hypothetical protein
VDALTAPAASQDGDGGFRPLHPAAPFIWRVVGVPATTIVAGVVVAIVLAAAGPEPAAAIAGSLALVGIGVAAWHPTLRYRYWRYRVGDDALELRHGVWFRTSAAVPFHRIQQIDVEQGPIQRRYDVVTLRLRTASAMSDATVPHLAAAEADLLRERLLIAARPTSTADDGH